MANLNKQYTFTSGTVIDPAKVNTNFDDLVAFVNNSVIHVDGTKAFTGLPSLPTDPTASNQPARKGYVDAGDTAAINSAAAAAATLYGTRAKTGGSNTALVGAALGGNTMQVHAGYVAGSTDATGNISLSYGPFPNGVGCVIAIPVGGGAMSAANFLRGTCRITGQGLSGCSVRWVDSPTGNSIVSAAVDFCWIAIGW